MSKVLILDDLPFDLNEQETNLFMNKIPTDISTQGIHWGLNDSVFRDNVFEYIIKEILLFKSIDDYYDSDIFKRYIEIGENLSNDILIGENKKFKISFRSVFYKKDMEGIVTHESDFEMIAIDFEDVKRNSFFELAKNVFKAGYVVKSLEIVEIKAIDYAK
jgi:hypothetical protein